MFLSFLNFFIKCFTKKDYIDFKQSLQNPIVAQKNAFNDIIKFYNQSEFSRVHGPIKTIQEFQNKIPMATYDDLREKIELQQTQKKAYFSSELAIHYEFTSGSSGKPKPIAYTQALMNSFHKMFNIWVYDLLSNGALNLKYGIIYISISPLNDEFQGHEDDSEYLGTFFKHLLNKFIIGHELKKLKDKDAYLECLCYILLSNPKLEIISIWSPSLLIRLIDFVEKNKNEILDNLRKGEFRKSNIHLKFSPLTLPQKASLKDFFPSLKLISCWADAQAKNDYQKIKQSFPACLIQKKGILATEAPMTLPLIGEEYSLPLLTEIFFEFINDKNEIKLINELNTGEIYSLLISTKGGLYRYQIGDNVLVQKNHQNSPSFEFVGRSGNVSDLCGEKLSETELTHLIPSHISYALFPVKDHYVICTENQECFELVSEALLKSPHYLFCIQAKQLHPPHFIKIKNLNEKIQNFFILERKMKIGDIKIQRLYPKNTDHELLNYLMRQENESN